jgi:trimeric autotransporter adhesin
MAQVPSNLIPVSITQLPIPVTPASEDTLLVGVYQGVTYKIRAGDLLNVAGVPLTRQVIAGTGLTGGGQLSSNVTLSVAPGGIGFTQLAASGVTPGIYGSASSLPQITVDSTGRVTAATSFPFSVTGFVPVTTEVIAGTGLTGGGPLNGNVTLNASLSNATPLSLNGSGSAGSSSNISRADHRHPSLNLSSDVQVDSILGISNGGTGRSLVMNPGAIIWSGSNGLYVSAPGTLGQVLVSGGTEAPTWGSTLIVAPVPANSMFAGPTAGGSADPTFRTLVNADLPLSGVVANTYGSGALVPVLVVNSRGVITSASTTAVTPAWSNVTGTPTTIAGYGITDGVTLTGTQILTNKTIDASLNTLSNIPNAALSNSSIAFTYAGGIAGSASVSLGGTNALSLSNVPNASLANSAITINGSPVSLGGSVTVTATASAALTIGTGLSGTSYNGSTAVTIAIDSTVATLSGLQTLTNKTLTSPVINEILDANGNEILSLSPVASATDYLTVRNGIGVGVPLHIQADGSSSNIGLHIQPKGTGLVTINDGTDFNKGIRFRSSGSAAGAVTLIDAVSSSGHVITLPNANTTLVGRDTTDTLTNKTISGALNTLSSIGNASLTNSSVTFNGVTVALGASGTITAAAPNALTLGAYLTGTSYNGSAAVTAAVDATDANTASKVVARDASGNFAAGTITAALSGNATTATTATNLAGGAASQIPYQTGAGATAFIANGTAGQVLTSAGSSVPVWSGISGGTF